MSESFVGHFKSLVSMFRLTDSLWSFTDAMSTSCITFWVVTRPWLMVVSCLIALSCGSLRRCSTQAFNCWFLSNSDLCSINVEFQAFCLSMGYIMVQQLTDQVARYLILWNCDSAYVSAPLVNNTDLTETCMQPLFCPLSAPFKSLSNCTNFYTICRD